MMNTPREDALFTDEVEHRAGQAVGRARDVHYLAEQCAQQEHQKPCLGKINKAAHIGVEQAGVEVHSVEEQQKNRAEDAAYKCGHVF